MSPSLRLMTDNNFPELVRGTAATGADGLNGKPTLTPAVYYRSIGFCRTAIRLKSAIHQQTLTSAERSAIELYVDLSCRVDSRNPASWGGSHPRFSTRTMILKP